jgi:hypothetical protein
MSPSAWLWVSMKPGASTRPEPSTSRSSPRGLSVPTASMRSPRILTLAAIGSAPVPSSTLAPTIRVAGPAAGAAVVSREVEHAAPASNRTPWPKTRRERVATLLMEQFPGRVCPLNL